MSTDPAKPGEQKSVLRRYEEYGCMGGGALGLIAGVMLSGPHFFDWPATWSIGTIVGGGGAGALLGRLFAGIVVGAVAAGAEPGVLGDAGHASGAGGDHGGHDGGGDA